MILLALAAAPSTAATIEVPALPSSSAIPAPAHHDELSLDLATAYEMALARNLDLQVGRYDIAAADWAIHAGAGLFDPDLTFSINGDFSKSPTATRLEGAEISESRNTRLALGLNQLLPTGTLLQFDTSVHRGETNSQFFFVNPRWNVDLNATLRQPLLNGFGSLVSRQGIIVARNARDRTAELFELQVIRILQQVENSYWNLVAARRAVDVSEQSLELAQRLLSETDERIKVGTSAPIDLVQSQAGVANRLQNLIEARNSSSNLEDVLKAVLGFDQPREWLTHIETTESYEFQPVEVDLDESITTALELRPELRGKQLELERLEYDVKLARNAALPNLDLVASYGYSGIGGNINLENPVTGEPIVIPGDAGDAYQQVYDRDFPSWTLGAQFSLPLGNNQAQGRLAQDRFQLQQGRVEMAALRQQIIREVRFAVRGLEDGAAQVDAAAAALELAERNLEAEQTKFANGLSTNYQVLQIQEDLAQAQLSFIRASLGYRQAMVEYRVATGKLLDHLDVKIIDPGTPDIPHDYWGDVQWLQFSDLTDAAGRITRPAEPVD